MQFPATFTPEEGKVVVRFRDIPEAITQGDDEVDAMDMAEDVLVSAMDFYVDDKRPVPLPSPARTGDRMVTLPLSVASKILLLNEMLAQNVGPSELARRMNSLPQYVNRLTDLHHTTKIDTVEKAMTALGKRFVLKVG
jgi:antitoxin HicB